jgi:hypothetical protein
VSIASTPPPGTRAMTTAMTMGVRVSYSVNAMTMPATHRNHWSVEMPLMVGMVATCSALVARLTTAVVPHPVPEAVQSSIAVSVEPDVIDFTREGSVIPPVAASGVLASTPVMHV